MRSAGRGVSAVHRSEDLKLSIRWWRPLATLAALAVALLVWTEDSEARLESELAFAGASARNFTAPPPFASEPVMLAALDHVAAGTQSGSLGGLFNRPGLLGGFAAGFLGAGLLGLFFGHGLLGGLNGVASFLGLIFQLALVVMLCRVIWTWWTGRNLPAFMGLSPRQLADPYLRSRHELLPGAITPSADNVAIGGDTATPVAAESAKRKQSAACGEG
jgi:predicted lipid-binding transport protein (Tim44 family)